MPTSSIHTKLRGLHFILDVYLLCNLTKEHCDLIYGVNFQWLHFMTNKGPRRLLWPLFLMLSVRIYLILFTRISFGTFQMRFFQGFFFRLVLNTEFIGFLFVFDVFFCFEKKWTTRKYLYENRSNLRYLKREKNIIAIAVKSH